MEYRNISIYICSTGIPLYLPSYNEHNIETVLAFDANEQVISNFTYLGRVEYDIRYQEIIDKSLITIDETILLYYSFHYQWSYHHYLTQCVPFLNDLTPEMKLAIPEHTYNAFAMELITLYGIDHNRIIILKDNTIYKCKSVHKLPIYDTWTPPTQFYSVINAVRFNLDLNRFVSCPKQGPLYLKRENGQYCGKNRFITNTEEFEEYLTSRHFEIQTMGDKSIREKSALLSNRRVIITQYGANLMNLIFATLPDYLIIISNEYVGGAQETLNICTSFRTSNSMNVKIFTFKNAYYVDNEPNRNNQPFEVDIQVLNQYLNSITS